MNKEQRIMELDKLRSAGIITDKEFIKLKSEIINTKGDRFQHKIKSYFSSKLFLFVGITFILVITIPNFIFFFEELPLRGLDSSSAIWPAEKTYGSENKKIEMEYPSPPSYPENLEVKHEFSMKGLKLMIVNFNPFWSDESKLFVKEYLHTNLNKWYDYKDELNELNKRILEKGKLFQVKIDEASSQEIIETIAINESEIKSSNNCQNHTNISIDELLTYSDEASSCLVKDIYFCKGQNLIDVDFITTELKRDMGMEYFNVENVNTKIRTFILPEHLNLSIESGYSDFIWYLKAKNGKVISLEYIGEYINSQL